MDLLVLLSAYAIWCIVVMRDWGGGGVAIEKDIESKKATKFAWPEMVIQTQSTEILGVARLDEKQWEVWCHIDTG